MSDIFVDLIANDGEEFDSDSIDIVGYDRESKTLYVEFHSGPKVYSYQGVEESTFNLFIGADSLNRFWREHISGKFTNGPVSTKSISLREEDETDTFDGTFDGEKWPGGVHPVTGEKDDAETPVEDSAGIRLTSGGIFVNGFTLNVPAINPARYGVKWMSEALTAGPFEPEFQAISEADALAQFNAQIGSIFGTDLHVKILAVTHYFD